jgi:SNF2 family DNA or RNA helicase
MMSLGLPFQVGSHVRCRNSIWVVVKIEDNGDGSHTVRLFSEEKGLKPFLYPHTQIDPVKSAFDALNEGRLDHIDHYRLLTLTTRLSLVYEYDKLLSISNSKMEPESYQLLAVKKVMESLRQRFLIADDVGLGKTIEAGLILQELTARQRGQRALIIVPAALQDQWKKEMQQHFLRKFFIYNSRKMEGIQELVDENLNPWLAKNSIITSIDWVKPQYEGSGASRKNVNRVFDQLMQVDRSWDLILIDEAHYVSTDSNRSDLAKALQDKCDSLLLLTATPHSGNPEHFFNLLNLIDPFMFSDPVDLERTDARERVDKIMIRRGKETIYEVDDSGRLVKKFRDREPHPIEIEFSDEEKDLYDAVSGYTAAGWEALSRKRKISITDLNIGKFMLTLVQKRMVSSLFALRETLNRRIDSIVEGRTLEKIGGVKEREMRRLLKDYDNGEMMEDEDRELVERYLETRKTVAAFADRRKEIQKLRELLSDTEDLIKKGQDSKLRWLIEFLRQLLTKNPAEKVIIFTEYRDTLEYLQNKLAGQWFLGDNAIVLIHGGMPLGEDEDELGSKLYAERRFNESDTRLLLATDAASEGLNLQRYCHIMVNYELPWNPNRLEQRIGRIHRYGQKRIATIYNLMIKGSKEAEIFKRLQEKIDTIRRQLGSMADVLGVLQKVSLDDLILKVLAASVDIEELGEIAEKELKKMEEMAEDLRKTQFLSGCRQFTREDIRSAEDAISESQKAIPTYKDVQAAVELFLRLYGDEGKGGGDGRKLAPTKDKGVYSLRVPSVIEDDKLPNVYPRITFQREVATADWPRHEVPEFLAFGHPLLDRIVTYCRKTHAAELGGKLACLSTDYKGVPGMVFNFILRFEDRKGRIVREELEPVFVDQNSQVDLSRGRKFCLAATVPGTEPSRECIDQVRERAPMLRKAAEDHIRSHYLEYHYRMEEKRNSDIAVLLDDLERFDRGTQQHFSERESALIGAQGQLFERATIKGQRTRLENERKVHSHRMEERRREIDSMRLGDFPAPELLNMVIVVPA